MDNCVSNCMLHLCRCNSNNEMFYFFLHLLFPILPQLEEHDNYVCKDVFKKKKKKLHP